MSAEPAREDTIQAVIRDWMDSYISYYDEHAQPGEKFKAIPRRRVDDPLVASTAAGLRLAIEADYAAERAGFDRADALAKVITNKEEEDE